MSIHHGWALAFGWVDWHIQWTSIDVHWIYRSSSWWWSIVHSCHWHTSWCMSMNNLWLDDHQWAIAHWCHTMMYTYIIPWFIIIGFIHQQHVMNIYRCSSVLLIHSFVEIHLCQLYSRWHRYISVALRSSLMINRSSMIHMLRQAIFDGHVMVRMRTPFIIHLIESSMRWWWCIPTPLALGRPWCPPMRTSMDLWTPSRFTAWLFMCGGLRWDIIWTTNRWWWLVITYRLQRAMSSIWCQTPTTSHGAYSTAIGHSIQSSTKIVLQGSTISY